MASVKDGEFPLVVLAELMNLTFEVDFAAYGPPLAVIQLWAAFGGDPTAKMKEWNSPRFSGSFLLERVVKAVAASATCARAAKQQQK
jgi:hypothetical protein